MRRMLCLLLPLCLLLGSLSGCDRTPKQTFAETYDGGAPATTTVAYIPLDDRPVHTTRVSLLAASAGFSLLMPPKDLYRTALDGRPCNENGTSYGDGAALLTWLENCEADYYVISLDQILSGGLVHSRWLTEITDETQKIDRLLALLAGKKAILYDTVMRLAPTVGYKGCTLEGYQDLRAYGMLPRAAVPGPLTADAVIAGYAVDTALEEEVVRPYLAARSRKLQLAEILLAKCAAEKNICIYYGVDDSHAGNSIQTNEIALIKQELKNGYLFTGTDEMGLMAVAALARHHYSAQKAPTVGVHYFGADPALPADDFGTGPLGENVAAHLAALQLSPDQNAPDMELLIYGKNAPEDRVAMAEQLLVRCVENQQRHLPTVIIDLCKDGSLPSRLFTDGVTDITFLLGYSSWNTAGNAIGIALSGGLARYLYLKHAPVQVKGASAAFLQGLALSFAKDVSYARIKSSVENDILRQGGRADGFCGVVDEVRLQDMALDMLNDTADPLSFASIANWMKSKHFLTRLSPDEVGKIPALCITDICFPWYRTFEADIGIGIEG